jgi:hypothetical protein
MIFTCRLVSTGPGGAAKKRAGQKEFELETIRLDDWDKLKSQLAAARKVSNANDKLIQSANVSGWTLLPIYSNRIIPKRSILQRRDILPTSASLASPRSNHFSNFRFILTQIRPATHLTLILSLRNVGTVPRIEVSGHCVANIALQRRRRRQQHAKTCSSCSYSNCSASYL